MPRFSSFKLAVCAALVSLASPGVSLASGPSPVELTQITHRPASLTLVMPGGEQVEYTPAALEQLNTYEMTTRTPWRDDEAVFQGVLLRDLLERHGMADVKAIRVRAENDFTITMDRAVWEGESFLIATRVDGRPHSRRERGPIQFVLDWDAYRNSDVADENHLVWMAAEITVVE
jgi:hypothetical protein